MGQSWYICIDLKSFYASVECADRGLDPSEANLVVADPDRGDKTICLAVSPALKALGVPGRCRVFEIPEGIDYVKAKPRMRRYMEASAEIYRIYLKRVSPDDMHVYSIDECFIDATGYLPLYRTDARSFAKTLIDDVFERMHIVATAGVGTNLFLAKVALDVLAKHSEDGIGVLDEESFRRTMWFHRPITDIWNIGPGIARRLEKYGARDLASVAAMREETLYREFGKNAEYLIDHAWGQEPCTMEEIRSYAPSGHSLSSGQVLERDYSRDEARILLREMVYGSTLELVELGLVCEQIMLSVGYARPKGAWKGIATIDCGHGKVPADGRRIGLYSSGTKKLARRTNSERELMKRFNELFDETVDTSLAIRRINVGLGGLLPESCATATLFDDVAAREKEHARQEAAVAIRRKFGKNALLHGTSLQKAARAQERNTQIGGHHA